MRSLTARGGSHVGWCRRFAVIGATLTGEDGVRDVTTAVDIGSKSWPFDIRPRPRAFRPHIGLLPMGYIAGGDVRPVGTNGLESGRLARTTASSILSRWIVN